MELSVMILYRKLVFHCQHLCYTIKYVSLRRYLYDAIASNDIKMRRVAIKRFFRKYKKYCTYNRNETIKG